MRTLDSLEPGVEHGRFHLVQRRRELLIDGKAIALGTRAFDILTVLIEARGALVTKDELLRRVWPSTVIEENTLQSHVYALRRALGKDRDVILTECGRGYRFVGEIDSPPPEESARPASELLAEGSRSGPQTNLPLIVSELIDRGTEIREVLDLVAAHRLVTLTGAGGIGKTRLALEVAWRLLPDYPDGIWLAEFAPCSDAKLVPATVSSVLGIEIEATQDFAKRAAAALSGKRLVIVLDNCEHVVEATAQVAETLLHAVAGVRILATSREPLGAEGEFSYRVPPLDIPPVGVCRAEDALRYGSVQLFVKRAEATDPHFSLDDRAAAIVGEICRSLDGIPLALEFAAARTATLGITGLATPLQDSLQLLTNGRRTALSRHKTLHATFEWSYGLLAERERVVLRRLAVFDGGFTLAAASAVVTDAEISETAAVEAVTDLIAKSLVSADTGGATGRYRLLETTRAYAYEKLVESGELEVVAQRHADHYRSFFEGVKAKTPIADWVKVCAPEIDNVRNALAWAFAHPAAR
jgi:predicted ATPase/DNA-binding winged helix-turn-helix (wHTH) protein